MPKANSKTNRTRDGAPKGTGSKTTGSGAGKKATARRTATCKTCGKKIRAPKGWTIGPAVRRHYWREHPAVMRKGVSRG